MGNQCVGKGDPSIDINSMSVIECEIRTASVYDKNIVFLFIDSVSNCNYILIDTIWDSDNIYYHIFETSRSIIVIYTNCRMGIVKHRLTYNRKIRI